MPNASLHKTPSLAKLSLALAVLGLLTSPLLLALLINFLDQFLTLGTQPDFLEVLVWLVSPALSLTGLVGGAVSYRSARLRSRASLPALLLGLLGALSYLCLFLAISFFGVSW